MCFVCTHFVYTHTHIHFSHFTVAAVFVTVYESSTGFPMYMMAMGRFMKSAVRKAICLQSQSSLHFVQTALGVWQVAFTKPTQLIATPGFNVQCICSFVRCVL